MTKQDVKNELSRLNIAQWQLAKAIGIHFVTLTYWLREAIIDGEHEQRIRTALEQLKTQA